MPSGALLRDPWSTGDLNSKLDPLQLKRNTAVGLATLDPLLAPGEPAWEIDAKKGKLGDGVTRYNALPYSLGVAGTGVTLGPQTIAGNNDAVGTAARAASGLTPLQARGVLDVPSKSTDFDPLNTAYSAHAADVAGVTTPITVTTAFGSANVTVTTALPAGIIDGTPIAGPGFPDYSFVKNIAVNRLSFQLSSNPITYNAATATATGTVTAQWRPGALGAHGIFWPALPAINPLNYKTTGFSGSFAMTSTFPTREKWEEGWIKGEKWMHSFEFPAAQRIFPLQESIASHVIVPVPSAFQVWSPFPTTTPWDFLEPNSTNTGRYKLCVPLESATQARIIVDWMAAGATGGSGAKLKVQYLNAGVWADMAENSPASTVEVAIDTGIGPKIGAWGVIDNALVALAATFGDMMTLRIVGLAATAAGSPSFGTVRIQFK